MLVEAQVASRGLKTGSVDPNRLNVCWLSNVVIEKLQLAQYCSVDEQYCLQVERVDLPTSRVMLPQDLYRLMACPFYAEITKPAIKTVSAVEVQVAYRQSDTLPPLGVIKRQLVGVALVNGMNKVWVRKMDGVAVECVLTTE